MTNTQTQHTPLDIVLNALYDNVWDYKASQAKLLLNAAPELLEACKKALPLLRRGNVNNIYAECANKIERAITKAEGTK